MLLWGYLKSPHDYVGFFIIYTTRYNRTAAGGFMIYADGRMQYAPTIIWTAPDPDKSVYGTGDLFD